MAGRPQKEGVDYSAWDVAILDNDEKIDMLIDAQSISAFTVYFYLCQKAYGSKGYFLEWGYSQCATNARKLGKGASAEFVKNVVDTCFQCCLFDKRLFELYGILTSRGMQKRYLPVVKSRTAQSLIREYWLLDDEDCAGLVFRNLKSNFDPPKLNNEPPKLNFQTQSKVKETKGNKTKVKESISDDFTDLPEPPDYSERFEKLWNLYPNKTGKADAMRSYIAAVSHGCEDAEIEKGIKAYAEYVQALKYEPKYIMKASTFFAKHSWEDNYTVPESKKKSSFDNFDQPDFDMEAFEKAAIRKRLREQGGA